MEHNEARIEVTVKGEEGIYTLLLGVLDRQTSLRSHPWPHKPGGLSDVRIFDLTSDDIMKFAMEVLAKAVLLKGTNGGRE